MIERDTVLRDLEAICRDVFGDPAITLTNESTAADVDGWNSLSHVRLIVRVEKHFGIKVGVRDAARLRNIGELVDLIARLAA